MESFRCYKCSSRENNQCLNAVEEIGSTSAVECDGLCTILRTEYTDIPGEVIVLLRDCVNEDEEGPLVPNGVRTEKHYTKMYTSCDSDLCNSGDGKRGEQWHLNHSAIIWWMIKLFHNFSFLEPGIEDNPFGGPTNVIVVPETGAGSMIKPLSFLALLLLSCGCVKIVV